MVPTVEAVLINRTLLLVETAPTTSKNRVVIPTLLTEQGTNIWYHSHGTRRSSSMKRGRNSESPLSRVSESDTVNEGIESQSQKGAILQMKKTWHPPGYVKWWIRRMLGNAYVASHVQLYPHRDREDMDLVKIYNIKQKDGETIEDFMERYKVETEHMKRILSENQTTTTHGNPGIEKKQQQVLRVPE
nr:hypothetical protein [Tanacetum cinerariifolium]